MFDIGVYAYLRALFFGNSEEFEQVSVDSERAFSDRLLVPSLCLQVTSFLGMRLETNFFL
jgi:hypothetical protein